jgi:hypothetical protein
MINTQSSKTGVPMQSDNTNQADLNSTSKSFGRNGLIRHAPNQPSDSYLIARKDQIAENMMSTYSIMPTVVACDPTLPDSAKILLSIVVSLTGKYGFCWASNSTLARLTGKSDRQVQRNLSILKKHKEIIVEVEANFDRKIWTPATWAYRDRYIKAYGADIVGCNNREEFNQRIYGYDVHVVGGTTSTSPYNIPIRNTQRHREEKAPPPTSAPPLLNNHQKREQIKSPNGLKRIQLEPMLVKGRIPTPGPSQMVSETKEFISLPFKCGSTEYLIADKDKEWFYGFSMSIINEAVLEINEYSKSEGKIYDYTLLLFKKCCDIVKKLNN